MTGLVAAAPVAAWAGSVTSDQMDAAALLVLFDGYTQSHKDKVDTLVEDETDVLTYNLEKGTSYKFIGVCDEDCTDLDLEAYAKKGKMIGIDYIAWMTCQRLNLKHPILANTAFMSA